MRDIIYISIHCSFTKLDMKVPISRIKEWHLKRGWSDVGYHLYIRLDGTVEKGRDFNKIPAAVYGFNKNMIAICYEGGMDHNGKAKDTRNYIQRKTLLSELRKLKKQFPKAKIKGHRDFPEVKKECPCFNAEEEYKNI